MKSSLTELDHRESNGIAVTLLWSRLTNRLVVHVVDESAEDDLEIECASHEALAVFHHPFAYAATRPVRRRRRAVV